MGDRPHCRPKVDPLPIHLNSQEIADCIAQRVGLMRGLAPHTKLAIRFGWEDGKLTAEVAREHIREGSDV